MIEASPQSIKNKFDVSVAPTARKKSKAPTPFSIRLSDEERARLKHEAGNKPLGTHIRHKLLGKAQSARKNNTHAPSIDYVLLGQILGALGKTELASNVCLLATMAESGSLPVDEETTGDLKSACEDIRQMRIALITALGV